MALKGTKSPSSSVSETQPKNVIVNPISCMCQCLFDSDIGWGNFWRLLLTAVHPKCSVSFRGESNPDWSLIRASSIVWAFHHKPAKTCNSGKVGAPCNEEAFKVEKYMFKFSNRNVGKNMHWINYPSGWTWQSVSKKQFCTEGVPIQSISECCSGNCPFPASSGHS